MTASNAPGKPAFAKAMQRRIRFLGETSSVGTARTVALICYHPDMTKEVTLRQAGGSVSATLPKDMADRLRLEAGDRVLAVETDPGILLTPYDPDAQRALTGPPQAPEKPPRAPPQPPQG